MGKGAFGDFFGFVPMSSLIIGKKFKKKVVDMYSAHCPSIRPTKVRLEHLTRANNSTRGDTDESRAFYIGGQMSNRNGNSKRMFLSLDGRTGMKLDGTMSPLCSYVLHREIQYTELLWDSLGSTLHRKKASQ